MQLTQADKDTVVKWLGDKCGQMRCFCCGQGRWTLMDTGSICIGFDTHTTRFHYHQGIPQVGVACENCGHILYFAAALVGLKPDQPAPAAAPAQVAGQRS